MEISVEIIIFLFLIAVIASYIDVLAGGGGLLTIPALIIAGLPPLAALGTNKFQSSVGTGSAVIFLTKQKRMPWSEIKGLFIASFLGALIGAVIVQFIDTRAINIIIPLVLVFIAGYTLISPYLKLATDEPKISHPIYQRFVVPLIGIYDGMFGPGTGSFFATAGAALRAKPLVQSVVEAKALNLASNIAALFVFAAMGQIAWLCGLIMIAGQLIGANLGARSLLNIRVNLLRYLIVAMSLIMLTRYVYQTFVSG